LTTTTTTTISSHIGQWETRCCRISSSIPFRQSFRQALRNLITPLREPQTHAGKRVIVRVRAGQSTNTLVRFDGFPQMERP
jgi:hypothetical protein